jgi:hypothetical protein
MKSQPSIPRSSESFTHTATGEVFQFNQLGNITFIVKASSAQIIATLVDGELVDEIWNLPTEEKPHD